MNRPGCANKRLASVRGVAEDVRAKAAIRARPAADMGGPGDDPTGRLQVRYRTSRVREASRW